MQRDFDWTFGLLWLKPVFYGRNLAQELVLSCDDMLYSPNTCNFLLGVGLIRHLQPSL